MENRLFLLEDPAGFNFEAYSADDYISKPQEGKANLNQIDDAWHGQAWLTENFNKHMLVPKYKADGTYELVSGDEFFDYIQKGDQLKDERDDAAAEVNEKETNEKLDNAINAISITPPTVVVGLYEAAEFSFSAYEGSDAYTHRVGQSEDRVKFVFGIGLPLDSAQIVAAQNGISQDRVEMISEDGAELATGLRIVDADGAGVKVEEGSIMTAFAPNFSPEEGIKAGKTALQELEEAKKARVAALEAFKNDNKSAIDSANAEKKTAEEAKARFTSEVSAGTAKLDKLKEELKSAEISEKIITLRTEGMEAVASLYDAKHSLAVSTANVAGYTKAVTALLSAGTEAEDTHTAEIAAADEAIKASKEDIKKLEDLRDDVNNVVA